MKIWHNVFESKSIALIDAFFSKIACNKVLEIYLIEKKNC